MRRSPELSSEHKYSALHTWNIPLAVLFSVMLSLVLSLGLSGCAELFSSPPTPTAALTSAGSTGSTIGNGAMTASSTNNTPQIGITVPAAPSPVSSATSIPSPPSVSGGLENLPGVIYTANVQIDMSAHAVTGTVITSYRNQSTEPLREVVFRIVPAETANAFVLTSFGTDDPQDTYTLAGSRLSQCHTQP